ncbi:unnamed protein product [Plutella xylostella]|uniref:(diamondback moth) hypothetical protein n=1 Tax=Plutella xylostella TaxID=51655 RepID=A0A8S4G4B7_PLUXY|nr:unnamed protein product [Plutella xylostella]
MPTFEYSTNIPSLPQSLLFNPAKCYMRGNVISGYSELELMTDCFVALFRIMPHNNDALKVCLNLNINISYHYVCVNSLSRIIKQPRLPWWPQIELLYSRAAELRAMFTDTLNKATQVCGHSFTFVMLLVLLVSRVKSTCGRQNSSWKAGSMELNANNFLRTYSKRDVDGSVNTNRRASLDRSMLNVWTKVHAMGFTRQFSSIE